MSLELLAKPDLPQPLKWQAEWRDIPGFSGYRACADGSIWSCWKFRGDGYAGHCKQVLSNDWKQLRGEQRKEDGRARYTLRSDSGHYVRRYASYFVLIAFVGERPDGLEACHNDGNCLNDAAHNLRWDTSTANKADMAVHGTRLKGEQINTAKLTEEKVRQIRARYLPGNSSMLANEFGVTIALICMVVKRKVWKHVA
jgi:hypothetical protein